MANLLLLDTETTGVDPHQGDILTAAFSVLKRVSVGEYEVLDSLDLAIKHEPYRVSAGALRVNKINLVEHDAKAVSLKDASRTLNVFLQKHAPLPVGKPYNPNALIPFGHNVHFDIDFIKVTMPDVRWSDHVSYRKLDTMEATRWLIEAGILPSSLKGSLESLTTYFNIPHDSHDARGDVLATLEVHKKLVALARLAVTA